MIAEGIAKKAKTLVESKWTEYENSPECIEDGPNQFGHV